MNNFISDRLGERLGGMLTAIVYRVSELHRPNSHLHYSWIIKDKDLVDGDIDPSYFQSDWVEPALKFLATEINKYDVALVTPLPCLAATGVRQTCGTEVIPVRYTVQYSGDLTGKNESGHRFTIDLLAHLLTEPEIK